MEACCNKKNNNNIFSQLLWFLFATIGNPVLFLCILPFPKNIFFYEVPAQNMLMLYILPYIAFTISITIIYEFIFGMLAYACKNSVRKFYQYHLRPNNILSLLWLIIKLMVGYTNLYLYTLRGMDATILGFVFLIIISLITIISIIQECITLYYVFTRRFA